LKLRSLHF